MATEDVEIKIDLDETFEKTEPLEIEESKVPKAENKAPEIKATPPPKPPAPAPVNAPMVTEEEEPEESWPPRLLIYIAVCVLIIAAAAWIVYDYFFKKEQGTDGTGKPPAPVQ